MISRLRTGSGVGGCGAPAHEFSTTATRAEARMPVIRFLMEPVPMVAGFLILLLCLSRCLGRSEIAIARHG